ncbi:hypothetical protein Tco_1485096 [Tanacetum coccineum]
MASFDYRYAIKECSSCGALYTRNCGCSKGSLEDKILVPCALIRKTLEEVFQDFQDTSESSDDDTTVCGDSLDDIFCQRCTYESLWKKGAHYGYYSPPNKRFNYFGFDQFQPPQYTVNHPISNVQNSLFNAQNELLNSQNKLMEQMTSICDLAGQIIQKNEEEKRILEEQASKDRYWKIPICYDGDEDYTIAITPVSSTKEPVNSLSMGDEHLDTIPATESDEVIKSSVEDLVPILSESEGIPDSVCDMPLCNNHTLLEAFKEPSEIVVDFNDDSTSSNDDSPYGEDIDYVDASPPDAEIGRSDGWWRLLSGCCTTTRSDYSLPDYEAFYLDDNHIEEKSSGSTTTHADFSQYDLSIDSFPPADRSDLYHEEFASELAHIKSPPEFWFLCFKI